MAKDKWYDNIFNYYRGRSMPEEQDELATKDQALENNVTKALINVLQLSHSENIRNSFLKLVRDEEVEKTGDRRLKGEILNYALQTKKPEFYENRTASSNAKYVLGIVPSGQKRYKSGKTKRPENPKNIPDAWLTGSSWTLVVESKCRGPLESEQITGHWGLLCADKRCNPKVIEVDWKQIHDRFKETVCNNPKDEFLRDQFCEFLKMNGLAGFLGFDEDDFKFLKMSQKKQRQPDSDDLRWALVRKLWALALDLHGYSDLRDFYPAFSDPSATLKGGSRTESKTYAGFTFVRENVDEKERELWNLSGAKYQKRKTDLIHTICLKQAHVDFGLGGDKTGDWIGVWAELPATMFMGLADALDRKRSRLFRILTEMPADYKIEIGYPNGKNWECPLELTVKDAGENTQWKTELLEGLREYASQEQVVFSITKYYSINVASGSGLVCAVKDALMQLRGFVDTINRKVNK